MNILFDIKTTQKFVGGSSEYTRRVFFTLLDIIKERHLNVCLIGLIDTRIPTFAYNDLSPESLRSIGVEVADIAHSSLKEIISNFSIDKIFIGCGQTWNRYDLENVSIPVVCVIHDLWNEEFCQNHINDMLLLDVGMWRFLKHRIRLLLKGDDSLRWNAPIINMLKRNSGSQLVTVSESTQLYISYFYNISVEDIVVLYSPQRISKMKAEIENSTLRSMVTEDRKFFLMLSANRNHKNAAKTMRAFKKYVELVDSDSYIATTGYRLQEFTNHIPLPYLSESDLAHAMKNCHALLFPSFFEGFGYPPVEVMGFGKPILVSNTSSLPEVCGDAAIYFSPFYESEIYKALIKICDKNYSLYCKKSLTRYLDLCEQQKKSLDKLINIILR